jgi:hypothetical protein
MPQRRSRQGVCFGKLKEYTLAMRLRDRSLRLLLGWLLAWLVSGAAPPQAPEEMTYIFNAPESSLDVRYEYHWEILRTALEKTSGKWGPYRMTGSGRMTEKRQAHELKNATGKLTVMYLGTLPDFEQNLYGVPGSLTPASLEFRGSSLLLASR